MNYYTVVIIMTLLALGVLTILISENDRISQQKKQLFMATNLLIALSALAECAGVHISGNANVPKGVLAAVKAVDYTLTPMTGGALIALMQKPNTKNRVLRGIFIANVILQVVSAFRGWMVVIDDQNHYTHGPLYPVYMVLYLAVVIIIAVRMLKYGKLFRKQNRKSLYATIILVFIGIAIQEFPGQGYRVSYLALTFGATFLFIHYSEFSQMQLDDKIVEQQIKLTNDALTGVLSRFAYVETIKNYGNCIADDFVVFLIDINGLKATNDSQGHEVGDELICGAANCIEQAVGANEKTFRIGGDEFVVFANLTREQTAETLRKLKQITGNWSGEKIHELSLSVGCVRAQDYKGFPIEMMVEEADRAMYEQKKAYYEVTGRDRRSNSVS